MSSLTSSYAGALILASMAALGAAYLGDKASTTVKMPDVKVPDSVITAVASVSGKATSETPLPTGITTAPLLADEATPNKAHLTEEEARRKLAPYVSPSGIDAMFKFVKTLVAKWSDIGLRSMQLSKLVMSTMTHPDKCPATMVKICALVFDKYSQMMKASKGETYDERGNVWDAFADLVDELPEPAAEPAAEPATELAASIMDTEPTVDTTPTEPIAAVGEQDASRVAQEQQAAEASRVAQEQQAAEASRVAQEQQAAEASRKALEQQAAEASRKALEQQAAEASLRRADRFRQSEAAHRATQRARVDALWNAPVPPPIRDPKVDALWNAPVQPPIRDPKVDALWNAPVPPPIRDPKVDALWNAPVPVTQGPVRPYIGELNQRTAMPKVMELVSYLKDLRAYSKNDQQVNKVRVDILNEFIHAMERAKFARRISPALETQVRAVARNKINGASRRTRRQSDHS